MRLKSGESMSDQPLISVTVCMRNAAHWIDDCMESLIQQTYRPLEIIAVDDGSTDGGDSKLDSWKGSHNGIPIIVLHQTAKGLSAGEIWQWRTRKANVLQSLISIVDLIRIGFHNCLRYQQVWRVN